MYDITKVGVKKETTWGTSAITGAGDTTYLIGVLADTVVLPYPQTDIFTAGSAPDSRLPQDSVILREFPRGQFTFAVLDGWPIWLCLGKSSTTGTNPYTHSITAATPDMDLPSFTLHHELLDSKGVLDDWTWQLKGLRVVEWELSCEKDPDNPLLQLQISILGKDADPVAFKLDNDPSSRIANAQPFHWGHLSSGTMTWKGANLNNLTRVSIRGSTNAFNVFSSYTKTPSTMVMPEFSIVTVELTFQPPEGDLFLDDLIAGTMTGDLVLKWERGTNDYIQFNGTDCVILSDPVTLARLDGHSHTGTLRVKTPSFTVVDSLAGGVYGE